MIDRLLVSHLEEAMTGELRGNFGDRQTVNRTQLVENVAVRRSLADAGRDYVARVHSPARIASRLVEYYQRPGVN